ncbi:Transcriptional regulator, IclR family [Burkholderia sp. 8Y]|uniref:IclR family transcriptional regulator n=1 Tax=Burkholderia sp. 8Y TaxID=2653133 RepID=UPI0012F17ABD|nr:IclR family transcriptional regulator [Burkholderia sp. 8Y]VXC80467.1 Transcriptional regulator, IclR family [Burkholderia sp. 8Y]
MPTAPPVTLTLNRGLQLLRAFHADRAPLTNGELAKRTGMSRSSVSRLIATLIHVGFVRRVAGGREFELATGAFGVGHAYLSTNPITGAAEPLMQHLADRLDVSAALAVPDHLDMLYIAYRYAAGVSTLQLRVGSLLPMGVTAIGRAWLWRQPEASRNQYVEQLLAAAGPKAGQLRTSIESSFRDLDANGVCMAVGEYQRHAYGIALPVALGRPRNEMALSCGAVDVACDIASIRARVVPALKETARELESLLGDARTRP